MASKIPTGAVGAVKQAGTQTVNYFQSEKGKKVLKLALIIVAGYIAYRVVKSVVKTTPQREEEQAGSNELDLLNQNSDTKQKITKQQAQSYANVLWTAMDGYGTDENAIYGVFYRLSNNADYLALSNAYGTRTVSSGRLNPEPNYRGTMSGALHSELDNEIVKKINAILTRKKITYKI